MSDYDEELINALENENNESIMELTSSKIKSIKNDILQKLQMSNEKLKDMHIKLKEYRYIDDINNINCGCYIRWFNLKDITPENVNDLTPKLGAFVTDIRVTNNGILISCVNIFKKHIAIRFDEHLIFQKITIQERVMLKVLDHLQKKN
jgi:hypothetical protein